MSTLEETTQGQEVIECKLCRNPVSFFCRRCGIDLCDTCVPKHLRDKSKSGHDVVEYMNKDDEEKCSCDLHLKQIKKSRQEMSELSNKIDKVIENIAQENDRLQTFRHDLGTRFGYRTKHLIYFFFIIILSIVFHFIHQKWKDEVTAQREDLHKLIDNYSNMKHMDMDMDDLIMAVLKKQKTEFEEMIRKIEQKVSHATVSDRKILETPSVSSVIDTEFPSEENNNRLYDMAVTEGKKVWMGGASSELKLFDINGDLNHTVTIPFHGMFICMYNKQVVFTDHWDNAVKKISDDDVVVTMFKTGDWEPYGITGTAFCGLLVCLRKDDQSKVVRYSSTGTVLQEIQYDAHGEPLYQKAFYITENVNGDIIVTDNKKNTVISVDKLGIFRYTYLGKNDDLKVSSVATDSFGHVFVADFDGNKIHMLNRDGHFLRYIIPEGGIKEPRALAMINDDEMIIGECLSGLAKTIKFLE